MLCKHRLVGKTFRHDGGTEMAGPPLTAGMASVKMGIVLDVQFKRVESA
jgi:hypothetical protein